MLILLYRIQKQDHRYMPWYNMCILIFIIYKKKHMEREFFTFGSTKAENATKAMMCSISFDVWCCDGEPGARSCAIRFLFGCVST